MFKPAKETIDILNTLNATYRMVHTGATMLRTEFGSMEVASPPVIRCEIIDKTLNEIICDATGPTEPEALVLACEVAKTAPKPLTPAQKADPNYADVQKIRLRNTELERQLTETRLELDRAQAGLNEQPAASQRKRVITTSDKVQ